MPRTAAVTYPNQAPEPPADWAGSAPEWMVYWALTKIGYQPNIDFVYQSAQSGGRTEFGGNVVDFYFPDLGAAINVQSTYYHYATTASAVHDRFVQASIQQAGINIVYIDEEDVRRDPVYYVKEALAGRDYSRMTGG
jgi:hypothetical protein